MTEIQGKGVYGAVAVGKIKFLKKQEQTVSRRKISDISMEKERYTSAREKCDKVLEQLYEKALKQVGESGAQIFDIHRMMLEDEDYNDSVFEIIENQQVNAEYAVAITSDNFAAIFSAMDDEYMKARAADVRDISNRVIDILSGREDAGISDGSFIICAEDLSPSETVQLDKSKVLAFVTRHGSSNSHTAILARSMNIPAVIGVKELTSEFDGMDAVVDGAAGLVIINPDEQTLDFYNKKQLEQEKQRQLLDSLKGKENITLDGRKINIYANITGIGDIGAALLNDAGGIGLFRSEFLYLDSKDYPDEQTQLQAYKKVLESMAGKRVIIRTLDIGADKQIDYFKLTREENPALGIRGIRLCLERREVFKTQLRALFRASIYGKLGIMFPMIASEWEITEIKKIIEEVKTELKESSVKFSDDIEIGIMIETPAAAIISDRLASMVDFFSVGTNDLTQYTLAADRQNPAIDKFCDTHHEAVLRLIKYACDSAHKAGIWIGVCGELAADLTLTEKFIRIGIDELSVAPPYVLKLREKIRNLDLSE